MVVLRLGMMAAIAVPLTAHIIVTARERIVEMIINALHKLKWIKTNISN